MAYLTVPHRRDPYASTFYDLCADLVGTLWWSGKSYSWGDEQIAQRT
ncbi:hypothetical protein ACRYCC_22600 [Actinomadura scrupuli]